MSIHSLYVPESTLEAGESLTVGGDQAHHCVRVLRLAAGSKVQVRNGFGMRAQASVTRTVKERGDWVMDVLVESSAVQPRLLPVLHVFGACPKGDRLPDMVDGLSQVGAASFTPLLTEYTVVDPREGKVYRLRRVAGESMKQCGRDWLLEIGEPVSLDDAMAQMKSRGIHVTVADATGANTGVQRPEVALFIGPEGGWSPGELSRFQAGGVESRRFGPHVMRVETAAVVAAAALVSPGMV
ncbi:MAG: RsmE family RNA methyltransferase [Planctomycetota bacterium]|nr:RsmE family RNA methyltransferase [Planctomycetota bacterium]